MKKDENENQSVTLGSAQSSLSDLRGRQSVRATFKLSDRAIDVIRIVANQMGIKQKSLFDHLIGEIESMRMIQNEIQEDILDDLSRTQKTFVLSRKTLSDLERIARDHEASRNTLIECSIQRLIPLISQERKKHHKRKELLHESERFLDQGIKMVQQYRDLLGKHDPVFEKLENAVSVLANACKDIEKQIEKGREIEDF